MTAHFMSPFALYSSFQLTLCAPVQQLQLTVLLKSTQVYDTTTGPCPEGYNQEGCEAIPNGVSTLCSTTQKQAQEVLSALDHMDTSPC